MWETSSLGVQSHLTCSLGRLLARLAFELLFRAQEPFCLAGCWSVGRKCTAVRTARRKHKHVILSLEEAPSCTMLPFCSRRRIAATDLLCVCSYPADSCCNRHVSLQASALSSPLAFQKKMILGYFSNYATDFFDQFSGRGSLWKHLIYHRICSFKKEDKHQFGCVVFPWEQRAAHEAREDEPQTAVVTFHCCLS